MKTGLIAVTSVASLLLFQAAAATGTSVWKALSFTERDSQTIQALVSNTDDCAALVRLAAASKMARIHTRNVETAASVNITSGCRAVSLNNDGKIQVLGLMDLSGGYGPLSYVAVFRHSGFLDETEMPVGEGNGDLGPISLSLEDIRHDGRLAIVVRERSVDANGHMTAHADPTPTVTHIFAFRNNDFALVDPEFHEYFASTVLPGLQQELAKARSSTSASPSREKEVNALQNSIALANRFVARYHAK